MLEKNKKYLIGNIEIINIIANNIDNSSSKGVNSNIWDFIDKYKKNMIFDYLIIKILIL